jgi:preprotein translocase subunit SecE
MSGVQVLQGALNYSDFVCKRILVGRVPRSLKIITIRIRSNNGARAVAKKGESALEQKSGFNPNEFAKETKEELDKVVWPSRQQLIGESLSVILMVTLSASLIYFVDQFFHWAQVKVFG